MKTLIAAVALTGSVLVWPTVAGASVLVAQSTPQEACRNRGGMIRGEVCMIDTVSCDAAKLAEEGVCIGREGEVVNLDEIITGPREDTPEQPGERG